MPIIYFLMIRVLGLGRQLAHRGITLSSTFVSSSVNFSYLMPFPSRPSTLVHTHATLGLVTTGNM